MRAAIEAWLSWIGLLLIGSVYATSFFLPALAIPLLDQPAMARLKVEVADRVGGEVLKVEGPSHMVFDGFRCFRTGWPSPQSWVHATAWYANPVLWIGCLLLLLRQWRWSVVAGCAALGLGSVMALMAVIRGSEGDVRLSVTDYRIGYWLWLASMGLLAGIAIVGCVAFRRSARAVVPPNQPLQQPGGA